MVQKQDVDRLLGNVRKAMGLDRVSGWILRECKAQLEQPIWEMTNNSVEEWRVPKEWKKANIVPLYKSRQKIDPLNYGRLSLTSVVGKINEVVIKEKWVNHVEENEVIPNRQFDFRQEKLCVTNLPSFYTRIIGVENRVQWMDVVYLDIKKAFDKFPHNRLLLKLEA